MVYKRAILLLILFGFFPSIILGQAANEAASGSVYSYLGVGFPQSEASAHELGMGIIGISFNDLQSPGLANPAFWGSGYNTRASAGFSLENYAMTEGSTVSSTSTLLRVSQLQIVLPIKAQKLGFSAALYPVTRSNYQSFLEQQAFPSEIDTLNYSLRLSGTGGISKFELGFGWRITKRLSIGYAPSLAFLTSNRSEELRFLNSEIRDNEFSTQINGSNISHRFGFLFQSENVFNRSDLLQLGTSVTLPVEIKADYTTSLINFVDRVRETTEIESVNDQRVSLPLQISGGITYFASSYLNFSVEGLYQEWNKAKYEINPADENLYSDRYFLGMGGQYHPYRHGSNRFLSKFKYSYGISYDTGHLNIQGEDISTLWFSSGLGILSPRARSSFDLSFQYGIRNVTSSSLIDERIWSISLSVNLAELMFIRPKLN